jgi:hypothetical protein
VTPNQVLQAPPELDARAVVLTTPKWLRIGFRALLLLGGFVMSILPFMSNTPLPLPWTIFAVVLGALTFAAGVWPRPWSRFDLFVATHERIAFPANELLVANISKPVDCRWLLVPWCNIVNVRIATVRGDKSPCVAFDVSALPEERAAFFAHVDSPADRSSSAGPVVFAAFDISPPNPKRTVARLLSLSGRMSDRADG